MSWASLALSPLKPSRNFLVPERAIVPRLSMTSSWLIPMPLSLTVNVPAVASRMKVTDISSAPIKPGFAIASKRSFSQASEAFEINSRRKISLCEYSEWMTNRRTCLVSAWNSLICGCVSVVMALQSLWLDRWYGQYPPFGGSSDTLLGGVTVRYFKRGSWAYLHETRRLTMAKSSTVLTVWAALAGNLMVAVAKFVAAAMTGSAAMTSEAVH